MRRNRPAETRTALRHHTVMRAYLKHYVQGFEGYGRISFFEFSIVQVANLQIAKFSNVGDC